MIKKKVYSHFIFGQFVPFTLSGWRFYPVTYNGNKYVVTLRAVALNVGSKIQARYYINRYREKSTFLLGHKGALVDMDWLKPIKLKNNSFLEVTRITETELNLYIKEIMAGVFEQLSRKIEKNKKSREAEKNLIKWDGKIGSPTNEALDEPEASVNKKIPPD